MEHERKLPIPQRQYESGLVPGLGRIATVIDRDPNDETYFMLSGLCRTIDLNFFFPSDSAGVENAQRVCADCPVKAECLEYALRYRIEHGVWGGTSERQRRRMLRDRRTTDFL